MASFFCGEPTRTFPCGLIRSLHRKFKMEKNDVAFFSRTKYNLPNGFTAVPI